MESPRRVCRGIVNTTLRMCWQAILDGMSSAVDPTALRGRVAVVAGATRGAGRGIAAALGEAGATVVCTGRSSSVAQPALRLRPPRNHRGDSANSSRDLGGVGVAVPTDHLDVAQVRALADRVRSDYGRIDILVNDIWGAEMLKGPPPTWNRPIWELDLDDGLRILRLGVDTHLITSHCLLPLLVAQPGGLLVEVTDGTAEFNAENYRLSVFYDLAKVVGEPARLQPGPRAGGVRLHRRLGDARLAALGDDARQLRRHRGRLGDGDGPGSRRRRRRRPAGVRRVGDAAVRRPRRRGDGRRPRSGALESAVGDVRPQLAREYGFTDLDGRRPDPWTEQ